MTMHLSEEEVKILLEPGNNLRTRQLGLDLILARSRTLFRTSPSEETLAKCTKELNAYITQNDAMVQKEVLALKSAL